MGTTSSHSDDANCSYGLLLPLVSLLLVGLTSTAHEVLSMRRVTSEKNRMLHVPM